MISTIVDTVGALRAQLWDSGFRPVPVFNPDAKVSDPGKQPLGNQWQIEARKNPPLCATSPAVPHAMNTGILCDGLRPIDVDVENPELAGRCIALAVQMLGEAPIRTRANSSKSLVLYRAAEGEPPKRTLTGRDHAPDRPRKIEVLGRGQQFVAFGRHPSGATLEWFDRPGEITLDALPAVTEEQIQTYLVACAKILGAPEPVWANGHDPDRAPSDPQADTLRIAAALNAIPNNAAADWEEWNRVGMAVWRATGGSAAGWEAFNAWSKRNDAYSADATRKRWDHYVTSPPTSIGAGSLFYEAKQQEQETPSSARAAAPLDVWDAGDDDYDLPPRGWLLGTMFCRQFLSSLVADGGTGKTAVRIAQLTSLAIGRSLTGEHVFQRCRVLILSLEDDANELRRRVYAVLRHHGLGPADVKGWLYLGAPKGLRLAEMKEGAPTEGVLRRLLEDTIQGLEIDVVSIDPFIKSHGLGENDNTGIDYVCTLLTKLAIDYNCAIDTPHHTKKGQGGGAGDADRSRGASSMKDAARLVYTLTPMTSDEAKQFGVNETDRRFLIRLDSGKVNIAPSSRQAKWFRLIGVPLGNGTDLYPSGDEVQTIEPWQPPDTWKDLDPSTLNSILDAIEEGMPNGSRYSAASKADDRAAWRIVVDHAPQKTEQQAREIIRIWVKNGLLLAEDYDDPNTRKSRQGLRVNALKRPS